MKVQQTDTSDEISTTQTSYSEKEKSLMTKNEKLLLIIGSALFILFILTQPAHAATITVCPADIGACAYTTIQNGINNAVAGDQINVTGTFTENLTVNVSVNISSNETLESNITGILNISAKNVNLSRFNISFSQDAQQLNSLCSTSAAKTLICIHNDSITLQYLNISPASVPTANYGILLGTHSNGTVINNNRITRGSKGIKIESNNASRIFSNNITVAGENSYPLYLERNAIATLVNINITSNYFSGNGSATGGLEFFSSMSKILVENNNITNLIADVDARNIPISISSGGGAAMNNSTFIGNIITNISNTTNAGAAIYVFSSTSTDVRLLNNTIANSSNLRYGLAITSNITAKGNLVQNLSGGAIGIYIDSAGNGVNVSENKILQTTTGIRILGSNGTISSNNVSMNRYGINLTGVTANDWIIYNNYFNNTINNANTSNTVLWNTTKTVSTNIMGGANIAGNFWHDYAGVDTDGDGIGDTLTPYTSGGLISVGGDSAPLMAPIAATTAQIHSLLSESNHTLFFNNAKFIVNVSNATFANFTIQAPNGSLAHRVGGAFVNDTNGTWAGCNGLSFCNATSPLVKFDANGTWYVNISVGNTSFSNNKTDSLRIDIWNNVTYSQTSWTVVTGNNTNQSFQLTFNWSTNETINSTCEHTWVNLTDASNFTYGCEPSNVSQKAWIVGNGTFNVWARAGGSSIFKTYLWNVSHNISDSGAYYAKNTTVSYTLASTSASLNWTNSSAFDLGNATINVKRCQVQNINVTGNISVTNINISYTAVAGFALAQGTAAPNATNFNLTNGTAVDASICFTPANANSISQNYWYAFGIDGNSNSINMTMQNITAMIPMSGTPQGGGGGGGESGGGGGGSAGVSKRFCSIAYEPSELKFSRLDSTKVIKITNNEKMPFRPDPYFVKADLSFASDATQYLKIEKQPAVIEPSNSADLYISAKQPTDNASYSATLIIGSADCVDAKIPVTLNIPTESIFAGTFEKLGLSEVFTFLNKDVMRTDLFPLKVWHIIAVSLISVFAIAAYVTNSYFVASVVSVIMSIIVGFLLKSGGLIT